MPTFDVTVSFNFGSTASGTVLWRKETPVFYCSILSLPANKVTNDAYKRSEIGVQFISLAGTGALDGDNHDKYWNVKKGL